MINLSKIMTSQEIWSVLLSLALSAVYAAVILLVYFTQLTTVRLEALTDQAASLLDFQKMGLFFNLDLLGYALMALSTFFAGLTIRKKSRADRALRAAAVCCGYADGYPRALAQGGAQVLIHGRRCPVLGRICMDQLMADVTDLEGISIGDRVTLIGRDGEEEITAGEVASWEGTINYEVVCALSKRVPRVYLKGGRVDSIYNQLI